MLKDILDRGKAFLDCEWGLVPHFSTKFEKFPCFYFSQNQPEKCVWRISRKEKSFFRLSEQEVKKVEKVEFFQIWIF